MVLASSNGEPLSVGELVRGFESCTLPSHAWTHQAHLTVALWYLRHYPRDEATRLIRTGIQRYNAANGKSLGYHETITLAWIEVICQLLVKHDGRQLPELRATLLEECGDKNYLLRFYSRERLFSDAARATWLPPDVSEFAVTWERGKIG